MLQNVLQIGNKIDICSLEKRDQKLPDGKKLPVLVSQLEDIDEDGELIIQMPTYQGKIILLSLGSRYELIFYTKKGLYRTTAQVTDRYKESNLFMVKVMLKSNLTKFQRREYFRLECIIGMDAVELDKETAMKLTGEQLMLYASKPEIAQTISHAVIVDISGGGIRFIAEKSHEPESYLGIHMTLSNEKMTLDVWAVVCVIACRKATPNVERYELRAEYMHLGSKLREQMIKYIFDEDRKSRKRDTGI